MATVIVVDYGTRLSIHYPIGPVDRALARLHEVGLVPPGTSTVLLDDTTLPPSRTRRHAWRLSNGRVVEDPTIPNPSSLKQALREEVEAATTVAALKAALLKVLG